MTLNETLKLVFKTAEAHANGHEHCREILEAVEKCREAVGLVKKSKKDE